MNIIISRVTNRLATRHVKLTTLSMNLRIVLYHFRFYFLFCFCNFLLKQDIKMKSYSIWFYIFFKNKIHKFWKLLKTKNEVFKTWFLHGHHIFWEWGWVQLLGYECGSCWRFKSRCGSCWRLGLYLGYLD